MPSATKPRRTLEDLEAAAEIYRPVQDRLVYLIAIDRVQPSSRNPRHRLEGLDELAESLKEYGLLQPVVVRHVEGGHELIAGHRRVAAARQLGWTEIAAVVRDETDNQAYLLTLTENLQREDLSPKEEAEALEVLVRERGWTTRQIGAAIKRSHMYVSKRLRVFDDPVLAPLVLRKELPISTAEELLRVKDAGQRKSLASEAALHDWSVPRVREEIAAELVDRLTDPGKKLSNGRNEQPSPRLASRVLREELAGLDSAALPARARTPGRARAIAHVQRMKSTAVGIDVPADFPLGPYDRMGLLVEKYAPHGVATHIWREWAGGWNGVAYRFCAAAEYDEAFTASYRQHSASPPFEERFRQEVALFGFFISVLSALECSAYATFALGALANPSAFPMATPRHLTRINLRSTSAAFARTFPGDALTGEFAALVADGGLEDLERLRNILIHRAQPPRVFVRGVAASMPEPTSWGSLVLDDTLTSSRRRWLADWLDRLLTAAEGFARAYL